VHSVRVVVVALAVAVALTGCSATTAVSGPQAAGTGTRLPWHGPEPLEPTAKPSFRLTDTSGAPYDFAARTAGRPTLLYFGYTNCPDECPTAMADIAAALRTSPQAVREQVAVVLVTTDPERDSGPVLRRFLDQFSTEFIGLRGTKAEVEAAQRAADVAVSEQQGPLPTLPGQPDTHEHKPGTAAHEHFGPLGYGVAHNSTILAYDRAGMLAVAYPEGVYPSDLAADLPLLARDG
jgi:protein SCO1/2